MSTPTALNTKVRVLYECGICSAYHEWDWTGDCREDQARIGSPEEYAEQLGVDSYDIEVRSMDDRVSCGPGGRMSRRFRVTWEIDLHANSPPCGG